MVHWSAKPRRERPSDELEKLPTHSIHTRQFRRWRHARDCCPELSNSLRPHCRCAKLCRSFGALVDGTMVPVGQLGFARERSAVLPEDTCGVESKSNPRAKCLLQRTRLSRCEGLGSQVHKQLCHEGNHAKRPTCPAQLLNILRSPRNLLAESRPIWLESKAAWILLVMILAWVDVLGWKQMVPSNRNRPHGWRYTGNAY